MIQKNPHFVIENRDLRHPIGGAISGTNDYNGNTWTDIIPLSNIQVGAVVDPRSTMAPME